MEGINSVILTGEEYLNLTEIKKNKYKIPDFIEINNEFIFNEDNVLSQDLIEAEGKNIKMIYLYSVNKI